MRLVVKIPRAIVGTVASFAGALLPLHADSPASQEFTALQAAHQKELAAATGPINLRYKAALEQLLKRATQENQLDEAVRIKAELDGLAVPPNLGDSKAPASPFTGTKWLWPNSIGDTVAFHEDGSFVEHYKGADEPGSWRVVSKEEVAVTYFNGKGKNRVKHFRLASDGLTIQRVEDKVSWQRDH